jgi:hypothetical protein
MKITASRWSAILVSFCVPVLCFQARRCSGQVPATSSPATKPYSLDIDYQQMNAAAVELSGRLGLRIGLEDIDYTAADMEKVGDVMANLRATATTRPLSHNQTVTLDAAERELAMGMDPQANFDVASFRLNGHYSGSTADELLDKLTANSPYSWSKANRTYLIKPTRGSILAFPVTLNLKNTGIVEVINAILAQQPAVDGRRQIAGLTDAGSASPKTVRPEQARVQSLVLNGVRADEALCRACEAADPPLCWELCGLHGQRLCGLYKCAANPADPVHQQTNPPPATVPAGRP